MATINQIRANRRNAQKSTGPKTQAGKERSRFNGLVHGIRAESAVIPGEDQQKFDDHVENLLNAWKPFDEMEKSLVEQIAVNQWKLARLDRAEVRIYDSSVPAADFATAIHRLCLTQVRLERSISATIADLERYRKERVERDKEPGATMSEQYHIGLIWGAGDTKYYEVLPQVCGLDGEWREIPREVLGDFSESPKPPSDGATAN